MAWGSREELDCRRCGIAFVALVVTELDPVRDRAIVQDDALMSSLSRIDCPACGWFEVRPIALKSVNYGPVSRTREAGDRALA